MSLKKPPLPAILSLLAALLGAATANAGDGTIEINQARALAGGVTPSDTPGFPVTLARSGVYVLTGSLVVPGANVTAVEITADDVTLDLNGFSLAGPATCTGSGPTITCSPQGSGSGVFAFEREGVAVRNGSVTGFASDGLLLFRVEACQLENLTVARNGGRGLQVSGTCQISGAIVDANARAGVFASTSDPHAGDSPIDDTVVRESLISGNGGEGVFTTSDSGRDRFVVARSAIWGNGDNGVELRTEGEVRDSAVHGNGAGGIDLGVYSDLSDSGLVRGTVLRGNGYGFRLDPGVGYTHNHVSENAAPSTGGIQMGPNVCDGDLVCP